MLQDGPVIRSLLEGYLGKLGGELDTVEQMFAEIQSPKDLEDVREMLADWDAHANGLKVRVGREVMSLQACVNRLRKVSETELSALAPGISSEMLANIASLINRHEGLSLRLERDVAPRIAALRERKPVERLLRPIADEVVADLTGRVLEEGELPSIRRPIGKGGKKSPPKGITEAELPAAVARRAAQMALVESEGNKVVYFYPEELEVVVRDMAQRLGDPSAMNRIRGLTLSALAANSNGLPVREITDIIPKGFVRSDKLELFSEFNARPLDMTVVARTIWKNVPQGESAAAVRAVVIKGGRKIYFVDSTATEQKFGKYLVPYFTQKELTAIVGHPDLLKKLLLRMSGQPQLPSDLGLVGGVESDGKISGLRVVPPSEMEKLSENFFKLHLRAEGDRLSLAASSGDGAPDLAVAVTEGWIGRPLDAVEKALFAGKMGYHLAEPISVKDLQVWPSTADPVRLRQVIPDLPDELGLVGCIRSDGKISGLRVVSPSEMEELSENFFKLHLRAAEGCLILVHAAGRSAAWIPSGLPPHPARPPSSSRGFATPITMLWPVTLPVYAAKWAITPIVSGARMISSAVRVLPEPVRAAVKNGAGFFLGEVLSEAVLGHWEYFNRLSPAKITRSYAALTAGGEAGRYAAAGLTIFQAVRAMPMVQGVLNRFLPLFGAIATSEAVETGHVDGSSLPISALHVLGASQIVHGGTLFLSQSRLLKKLGQTIGLVSRLGKATFMGAVVSTVAEFTLIKAFGVAENNWDEQAVWGTATWRLVSIVTDDQVGLASDGQRRDTYAATDAALSALEDQIRAYRELARQARASEFVRELSELELWRKNALATPATERSRSMAEIDEYYDNHRRKVEAAEADALRPFAPKPHVTFIRLSADGYARVPGVVVKVQYERERDEFGFPVRVELPAEAVDASADNVPDHHHALSSYYRVQLPPNRDWDALLEQIAQYRRDRMERPLQDPVPQLPQQILQLAQK